MTRSRYKVIRNSPHFITCTIVNWIPLFMNPDFARIPLESLKYMQDNNRVSLYGYVIMENHLHLVVSSGELSKEIGIFKSYTARKIIDLLKERKWKFMLEQFEFYREAHKTDRDYQVWQEGSHPEMIQGEDMLRQKMEYIHANPVRRGYVDKGEYWRYSSARVFAGEKGLLELRGWDGIRSFD